MDSDLFGHTTLDTYILIGLIVDVIIFFFGLVGNLLVIHVQRKSKRQTRARYFLQLNALGSIMQDKLNHKKKQKNYRNVTFVLSHKFLIKLTSQIFDFLENSNSHSQTMLKNVLDNRFICKLSYFMEDFSASLISISLANIVRLQNSKEYQFQ